jgi:hypothetical protein
MNFPSKKALYNKQSILDAISSENGQYGITILATLGKGKDAIQVPIKGILKDQISFGVEANWETLPLENIIQSVMSSNPILHAVDTLIDIANLGSGSSFVNTGIFSKLFYKNSGRLEISPNFRIFDHNGSGICTQAATILSALCIPTIGESIPLKDASDNLMKVVNSGLDLVGVDKNKLTGPGQQLYQNVNSTAKTVGASAANWSNSPNPVSIRLGKWLTIKEAVITSVNNSFSYECTDAGPIYLDVSLRLRTIENLAIDKSGNLQQVRIGSSTNTRVNIIGSNQIF